VRLAADAAARNRRTPVLRRARTSLKRSDEVLLAEAFAFACLMHRGQTRKGSKVPYIVHPAGVALMLQKHGAPARVVAAGFLHDTLEDTAATPALLRQAFGSRVASLVRAASEPLGLSRAPDAEKRRNWRERKEHKLAVVARASREFRLLVAADMLDNLSATLEDRVTAGEAVWDRFRAPKRDQEWYYRSQLRALARGKDGIGREPLYRLLAEKVRAAFGGATYRG